MAKAPLSPGQRLTCVGATMILASMLLPWYGLPLSSLTQSGFAAFGAGAAALLLTAGAAVAVVVREAAGKPPVRPLGSGALVMIAGVWAALLALFLVFDRPDELGGSTEIKAQYGVYVAVVGGLVIAAGGMRMRRER